MKISILCPTRERVDKAYRFALSVLNTAAKKSALEILFYVDSDDPELSRYETIFCTSSQVKVVVGRADSVSRSWNYLAHQSTGDVLIMGNDDLEYKTHGWDEELREGIAGIKTPLYCAWMNDGINGDKHCAFPVVPRLWYETLGRFTCGMMEFGYNDTWIFDVAKRARCAHYFGGIIAKHHHGSKGGGKDSTWHRNRGSTGKWTRDKKIFTSGASVAMREAEARIVRECNAKK